jgi:protein-disulfide isomerase
MGITPALANGERDEHVVATVGSTKITLQEVDEAIASRLFALEQQKYALRQSALDSIIASLVTEQEAKKRGVRVEELRSVLTRDTPPITPAAVEEAYRERGDTLAFLSAEEARAVLSLELEKDARLAKYRDAMAGLRDAANVDIHLPVPRIETVDLAADAPLLGRPDAPVLVTMFSDFECHYCREAQATIRKLHSLYPDSVRVAYKAFPLRIHAQAMDAARAAHCAARQNRFWEFHDALFDAKELRPDVIFNVAKQTGLDLQRFAVCVASDESKLAVQNDMRTGRQVGVSSTPSFVLNGRFIAGNIPLDDLKHVIDEELAAAAPAPVSRVSAIGGKR